MALEVRNGKIYISQKNMDRLYHGSKRVWEVLRLEGAQVLVKGADGAPERLPDGMHPRSEVVGIDLMDQRERYLTSWAHKFLESIPTTGEKRRIKECRVQGLPVLVAKDKR